jgi:dolichol-phosphate mannosyltransferase
MIHSLSIVVPAFNEEPNLARTVLAAHAALQSQAAERLEWILVDDGSTDGTWSEMTGLADFMSHAITLKHPTNKGLGAAIWTGMTQASSDWCTWMPADGQLEPQALAHMARLAGESDLVLLMRDEDERARWRRLLTLALYGGMRILFGFDPFGFSGVYLVRRQILRQMPLYGTTAVQNYAVALHCQSQGYRIQRTRTVIRPRTSGKSKVANLPTMLKTIYDLVRLRFTI